MERTKNKLVERPEDQTESVSSHVSMPEMHSIYHHSVPAVTSFVICRHFTFIALT